MNLTSIAGAKAKILRIFIDTLSALQRKATEAYQRNNSKKLGNMVLFAGGSCIHLSKEGTIHRGLGVPSINYTGDDIRRDSGHACGSRARGCREGDNNNRENLGNIVFIDGGACIHLSKDGRLHRSGGLPAITYPDGGEEYWLNGKRHRDGGQPAYFSKDGTYEWWVHNKLHRGKDLPAVVRAGGTRMYYRRGLLHRGGDRPAVEWNYGRKEYWKNGKLHRDNGLPAVVCADGGKEWWFRGELHREGGLPAIERPDGTREYWIDGIKQG